MAKRILVNCSNHPSSTWSSGQKEGWDEIIDVPFPNVEPEWDTNDKPYQDTVTALWKAVTDVILKKEDCDVFLYVAGEYSVCYEIFLRARNWLLPVVVPTTRREVVETKNADGSTTKTSKFEFIRWRLIG